MNISNLFERDVTREIPPVIYFHEKTPEALQAEVDEYIITGGYPDNDHRRQRVEHGIHEEYVRLLRELARYQAEPAGEPASWISGFYGSGKSSFAKMLGLALDNPTLPDGRTFEEAFLARNQTPLRAEFLDAWKALRDTIDPVAVVFDVGGEGRGDEAVHVTILRNTLQRFGYAVNARVAFWEVEMERDAYYDAFVERYAAVYGRQWSEGRHKRTSDMEVSAVMHDLMPETYDAKDTWRRIYGRETPFELSANDVRDRIEHVLKTRAPGKTLFLVVDEVSQYIIGHEERMLHLQSFNSAIAHLRGKVWLLATGQQKLEEQGASNELGKMQARFPSRFRIHLGEQNIREVVHKRLLKKSLSGDQTLRELFRKLRQNLKLYAYDCQEITEEDFVEVYPLLPGHISLLLDITTQMRHRSSRMQGDSHSVRGLMQLLGDLFRERKLAERPVGDLICFDDIYDVQATSLDVDTQRTMEKIRAWANANDDDFAYRVAKVVALLQLVQEERPTTLELVAQCLYNKLDRGPSLKDDVKAALERMRTASPAPLISYSERNGYRLESSARAEWNKERDQITVGSEKLSEVVQERLKSLLDDPNKPTLKGVPIPYEARYSDSRGHEDVWLRQARGQAAAPIDLRLLSKPSPTEWIQKSGEDQFKNRLVWLAGAVDSVYDAARNWAKSRQMVRRYEARRESLTAEQQTLLIQERAEEELLARRMDDVLKSAFMSGTFYFRGREISPSEMGTSFATALEHAATNVLEDLYPHFTTLQVTAGELDQLFADSLSGASRKFFSDQGGLGILDIEHGQPVPKCDGTIPSQILHCITEARGATGSYLFDKFSGIPYGYSSSVIKACLLGLLRAHKIRIVPRGGGEISSYADPGTKDLFSGDRDLRNSDFMAGGTIGPEPVAIVQIAKMLEKEFAIDVDREILKIAEVALDYFPSRRTQLNELRNRVYALNLTPPGPLDALDAALTAVTAGRDPVRIAQMLWNKLDDLRDGFQQLNLVRQELTDQACNQFKTARATLADHHRQLAELGVTTEQVDAAAERIRTHLAQERPWRGVASLQSSVDLIRTAYETARRNELAAGGESVEAARAEVKMREGFSTLNSDDSNYVLSPLSQVMPDTDATSLTPPLSVLRARRGADLSEALEESHARLDELLQVVVVVKHGLNGKMIHSQEQLDAALESLRKQVSEQLSRGKEVR